ncbi:type III secretion inner membrane ring lipoprotein SctJ [Herbaspirillum sp. RTI4]|uniref:type III secretion system inner membrane ring lipoprotein SctJ n=1 Tax=Herbaspirillum sp. RTI4 TaxID=3048640 RepID=UPI002AB3C309|nr:type III secretion inner membrane ring lipoprotein SctJ [Herbaspirillum sp. RTI4]MDY7577164.1 type III secretion inner membrane ring lipoprotein SctJ [Herbaspirillum sp. RTI4]MEA9980454.1 type III secretion inner membrane ring lipoprotein SctJ [Herbaspirillum sp. RTI4]
MSSLFRPALLLSLPLLLMGCKEDIYTGLSERDANAAVVHLGQEGINAEKITDGKSWSVSVDDGQALQALGILRNNGLPGEQFSNLGELFKTQGMIATPAEERMRYIYGLSQELARSLRAIDGVIAADVHVALPANDPLSDVKKAASAGVFIKFNPEVDLAPLSPMIKELVAHSIEGLTENNVSLTLVPALRPQGAVALSSGTGIATRSRLAWAGGAFLLGMLVGAALLFLRHAGGLRDGLADLRLAWHARVSKKHMQDTP